MAKTTLHIDVHDSDREWVKQHLEDVDHLIGLVQEMFGERETCLLSPVFRRMILEHAQKVKVQRNKLAGRELFLDNPGRAINEKDHTT